MRSDAPGRPAVSRSGTAGGPLAFLRSGWRHRDLIGRLTRSKLAARYQGTLLGPVWLVLLPLLMLGVYTFVFSGVFAARWGAAEGATTNFALVLFSGLIVYTWFAECLNEAPGLLFAHEAFIKQVLFPVDVLSWVSLLVAGVRFAASFALLAVFYLVLVGSPPASACLLPLVLVPVVLLTLGTSWLLSSLGLFLRDISQAVAALSAALLFLSPVFYPVARVPESFRPLYLLNPFATVLEDWRLLLFEGVLPDPIPWLAVTLAAWGVAWLGHSWFVRSQPGFADVL